MRKGFGRAGQLALQSGEASKHGDENSGKPEQKTYREQLAPAMLLARSYKASAWTGLHGGRAPMGSEGTPNNNTPRRWDYGKEGQQPG